jgi:hypothetical protein
MELLEDGHRRRRRRSSRTLQGLWAGRSSGWTKPECTAASGRHGNATSRERDDAAVRCTGLEELLLAMGRRGTSWVIIELLRRLLFGDSQWCNRLGLIQFDLSVDPRNDTFEGQSIEDSNR